MLRAAKSLPNLRQSSKSFASQALFSERSAASYRNFNVTQLKAELKTRGLAVSGRKADLISRLHEADEHGIRALASQPDGKRYASKKTSKSQARPAFAPEGPEPVDKQGTGTNVDLTSGAAKEDKIPSATPPLSPYIKVTESTAQTGTTQTPVEDQSGGGRISTAALESTLEGGGPTSPGQILKDQVVGERNIGQGLANRGIGNPKPRNEVNTESSSSSPSTQSAAQAASQVWSSLGEWETSTLKSLEGQSGVKIQPFSEPISSTEHKAESYKWEDRPLNSKERGGLWKLGGTVAGGWLLATLLAPKERKDKDKA